MYCDASKDRLGWVLMQSGKVVSYGSLRLKNHEQSYPTHNMELACDALTRHPMGCQAKVSHFGIGTL